MRFSFPLFLLLSPYCPKPVGFFLVPSFQWVSHEKKKYTSPKGPDRKGQKSAEFQVVYGRRVTQPFSKPPLLLAEAAEEGKILELDRGKLVLEKSFFFSLRTR